MAEVRPFRGIRYNSERVHIETVVAPPYDVINSNQRDALYERSPFNIVRLILNKEEAGDIAPYQKHARAALCLKQWLNEGILIQDKLPSIYLYNKEFDYNNKRVTRLGFMVRLRLEDDEKGIVYPHENTLAKPKEDRLMLTRMVKANMSPIFGFYEPSDQSLEEHLRAYARTNQPVADMHTEPDDVRHRLWLIPEGELTRAVVKELEHKKIFIADGHHRYEVARMFRDEMRKTLGRPTPQDFDYILCYLTPLREESVAILPIYRLVMGAECGDTQQFVGRLEKLFTVTKMDSLQHCLAALETHQEHSYVYGVYLPQDACYFLFPKDVVFLQKRLTEKKVPEALKVLGVTVLHRIIFEELLETGSDPSLHSLQISYTRDLMHAKTLVDIHDQQALFLINPTRAEHVKEVASQGEKMPPKSTYFYPKALSGLVINRFDSLQDVATV
ncbi:MAG: DUF1015 domain-containing protein [Candidatus Omnitrophica bacterium]|nr:DUF1015 domain-containing protein [Candidatus Omnitrophota bacterium]